MDRSFSLLALLSLLVVGISLGSLHSGSAATTTTGTPDGSELWGGSPVLVVLQEPAEDVDADEAMANRPLAAGWPQFAPLWVQKHGLNLVTEPWSGRPVALQGASGVGFGNFQEIGPLDVNLQPRNSTWLSKADLIFVDNPVGVGYSYVEDDSLLVTTDWQQAEDATTLLKALVKEVPTLQSSPLFLVAESYGGKYAATLGASVARAARAGELNITLGGVALGDSWISPEDFTLSYTPLLLSVSRLDDNAADEANKMAETVKEQIAVGNFSDAEGSWSDLLGFIGTRSGDVDVYNFLDGSLDQATAEKPAASLPSTVKAMMKYSRYLSGKQEDLPGIMNGVIKEKLKIIPKNLKWQVLNDAVYNALVNDIMKPRIEEIDELLSYGVNVTVYNGQLDIICSTIGAEAWVQKLKWDGLKTFLSLPRQTLYCGSSEGTKAFVRSYSNLHFYWILGAGHYVPVDQPCIALSMIGNITQSPAS
ncbi:unnamed protein product [Miscanthus lutarioriparius]|uniref:Carboxypeptidase n=1 Tax=Miscanthus lutarioriparius TaxID=422564 RepID=A0A811SPZ5_9POAL|nr:unnamed protein product [Miscanthus lutarioriparius]